ncbi:MAG: HD domain-containing protein [Sneathiella sp.]
MSEQDFSTLSSENIVAFISDIFLRRGADSYLGEDVTMSEHMLQGAQLAEQSGAPEETIVAALLHDIGHYTNEFPEDALENGINNYHGEAGAAVLEPYFPERVTDCVRYHVAAKRYLCAVDPDYFGKLSEASVHTLGLQGGPMNKEEVQAFKALPFVRDIIQIRIWDDAGKVAGVQTPDFAYYAPMVQHVVDRHSLEKS